MRNIMIHQNTAIGIHLQISQQSQLINFCSHVKKVNRYTNQQVNQSNLDLNVKAVAYRY